MNLDHLSKEAAAIVQESDAQRIKYLKRDQFVPYPRAKAAVEDIADLVDDPDKVTPRGIILVGESQMGKSAIINEVCKRHPADDNVKGEAAIVKILRIQFPETQKDAVYGEILRKYGAKLPASARPDQLRATVLHLHQATGVQLFVVDELANVKGGSKKAQTVQMNSIKFIMNDRQRPVVLAVTKDVYTELSEDEMVRNRFDVIKLARFTNASDPEFVSFLIGWELALPLKYPSELGSERIATQFFKLGEGHVGQTRKALMLATRTAIVMGVDRIDNDVLEQMKFLTPQEVNDMAQKP